MDTTQNNGSGSPGTSGTDSLVAEYEDLRQTLVCVQAMTRDFETMTERRRKPGARLDLQIQEMAKADGRSPVLTEAARQEINEMLARRNARLEEIVDAGNVFCQTLIAWAKALEKRRQQSRQDPNFSPLASIPIVTSGNARIPDDFGSNDETRVKIPAFKDTGIVIGAIAGTVGDAMADTFIAFGNSAGPAKAPYNPVDSFFGYQDAFWRMLGFKSRPIGSRSPSDNAQLGEALENAMFALHGYGAFAVDAPKLDPRGAYETTIQWGVITIPVRQAGPGFWGPRIPQTNPAVDAYELQINPNNESYYLPHPDGRYVQFENLSGDTLQDGKFLQKSPSIYDVEELPSFASKRSLQEAIRQVQAASAHGLRVQWLVSDEHAALQLRRLFRQYNVNIDVDVLAPKRP